MLVTIRFELPDGSEYTRHWYHVPRIGDAVMAAVLDTSADPPAQHIVDLRVSDVRWVDEEPGRPPIASVLLSLL